MPTFTPHTRPPSPSQTSFPPFLPFSFSKIWSNLLPSPRLLVCGGGFIFHPAEKCFTKNDVVLANRPKFIMGKYLGYNYTTLTSPSYGDHWRNLRRIGAIEIYSSSRLNAFAGVRLEIIPEAVSYGGSGNPADFLPVLNWFGGFEKKVKKLGEKMDGLMQKLIDQHRCKRLDNNKNYNNNNNNSTIDHLLNLQQSDPHYYTDEIIKGLMLVLIFAGIDTSAVTLEWAMGDPKSWEDPTSFKPERFANDEKLGVDDDLWTHKLMPFGLGRRACPGAGKRRHHAKSSPVKGFVQSSPHCKWGASSNVLGSTVKLGIDFSVITGIRISLEVLTEEKELGAGEFMVEGDSEIATDWVEFPPHRQWNGGLCFWKCTD
ncbi:hypothetical protein F3Y22_tig00111810pilonHSYRG00236 [Hibiscus syriacus]|uniref:Uncharacterized protein n=1 Tax=Hibiscus syriacus TaxID=106335 RepID=A0A6A2YGE7_HIBSY|nr:hypothetical protein F3Y22_tig00111810pilonHSYRG00236 [Hibiscus syriacus]